MSNLDILCEYTWNNVIELPQYLYLEASRDSKWGFPIDFVKSSGILIQDMSKDRNPISYYAIYINNKTKEAFIHHGHDILSLPKEITESPHRDLSIYVPLITSTISRECAEIICM